MKKEQDSSKGSAVSTRDRLLDAAERLFAERGIDNVTLLDVTRAAGQRNRWAAQYHFGEKASLLKAVFDRHTEAIAAHRERLLDALEAQPYYTLREVVAALVVPVAHRSRHGGERHLHISSQLMTSSHWSEFRLEHAELSVVTARMRRMLAAHMPKLPKPELEARLLLIDVMLFHGPAAYASRGTKPGFALFTDALVDAITAVLIREAPEQA